MRRKAGSTSVDSNSVLNWNYCVQSVGLRSWFIIQVEESGVSIPVPNEEYQIRSWMSSCRVLEQNSFSCLWNLLQILHNLLSTADLCTQSCRSDWLQSNYRHNSNRITAWKLEKVRGRAVDPPFQFETVLQQAKPSIQNAATFTFPWLGWNVFPLCTSIMKSLNSQSLSSRSSPWTMSHLCFHFRGKNTTKNIIIQQFKSVNHLEDKWIIALCWWLDQFLDLSSMHLCRNTYRLFHPIQTQPINNYRLANTENAWRMTLGRDFTAVYWLAELRVRRCIGTIAKLLITVFCSKVADGRSLFSLQSLSQVPLRVFFPPTDSCHCGLPRDCKSWHSMVQLINVMFFCEATACKPGPGPGGAVETIMIIISVPNPPRSGCLRSD